MYEKEPACDECMPVELNPENVEPFQIYQICRNQLITAGMSGVPIDINIPAIMAVMDVYQVKNKKACFEKVLKMARLDIQEINIKQKEKGA